MAEPTTQPPVRYIDPENPLNLKFLKKFDLLLNGPIPSDFYR
jgi:hypothetical protein